MYSNFGKKGGKWIQQAFKKFEKTGTKGSFKRWCIRKGYPNVSQTCINEAKKSKQAKIRKKAIFAQNIRFGNSTLDSDIRYLK